MNQRKQTISLSVLKTVSDVGAWIRMQKENGHEVGFVPTMGALHAGHATLIQEAAKECGRVIVSIFVNPTQFNAEQDFNQYPITPEEDLEVALSAGAHAVFMPSVDEIYRDRPAVEPVNYGDLTSKWEAADRPGHFDGVVAVVDLLFQAVRPNRAYFGEKDLQQLAVVRRLVSERHPDIDILGCPLIRDVDGLALSSRNARLTPEARNLALGLSQTLFNMEERIRQGQDPNECLTWGRAKISALAGVELAYLDLVESTAFSPWDEGSKGLGFAILAATIGGVRLLDNHCVCR